jgi:hypothetical protein
MVQKCLQRIPRIYHMPNWNLDSFVDHLLNPFLETAAKKNIVFINPQSASHLQVFEDAIIEYPSRCVMTPNFAITMNSGTDDYALWSLDGDIYGVRCDDHSWIGHFGVSVEEINDW